jgi:hypothetical protein
MHGHKPFGDDGFQDIEPFGEESFQAVAREPRAARYETPSRPARQRLELLHEDQWLKRQLADWDDLDFDVEEDV